MSPAIRKLQNENITIYTAPTRSLLESLDATNQVLLDILNRQTSHRTLNTSSRASVRVANKTSE